MLTKINNPFITLLAGYFHESGKACNKSSYIASSSSSSSNLMVIGLQISLIQTSSEEQSNIILKSTMKKTYQLSLPAMESNCFLKSCFLCNKNLSKEKDIYMYRGDQGYCSIECRNRQIYLDEMKELEASTKKMRPNYRYCSSSGRHETRLLREEFRRRNAPVHTVTDQENHWAIVSFS